MADGILGLGSGQSATLSSDLIDKLKTAERKSTVAPIETRITNLSTEKEFFTSVESKVKELLDTVKPFDLFVTGGINAFEQKSATTSGDSVTFDAADISSLKKGFTSVSVSQLAQKDVYQSNVITDKSTYGLTGTLNIAIGSGAATTYTLTNYSSYDKLIEAINTQSGVDASLEQVGTSSYRLVLKSDSTGVSNKLVISENGSTALGFETKDTYQSNSVNADTKNAVINQGILTINGKNFDTTNLTYQQLSEAITAETGMDASVVQNGTADSYKLIVKSEDVNSTLTISGTASSALGLNQSSNHNPSHVLTAQNMKSTIDGVAYDLSTNVATVNGLKITANKVDTNGSSSSINVVEDTTNVETQMNSFVSKYNELVSLINTEIYSSDSKVENKSALKDILNQVKEKLFGSYGSSNNKSIFNYGFELDKSGTLSFNSTTFNSAIQNDMSGLKDLFIGTAEKKGLGTLLKESISEMSFVGGILNTYDKDIINRESKLNESKTKAEDILTAKYNQLATQFSAYTSLITQMESSFSGLKMMISQSVSGN